MAIINKDTDMVIEIKNAYVSRVLITDPRLSNLKITIVDHDSLGINDLNIDDSTTPDEVINLEAYEERLVDEYIDISDDE